MNVKNELLKITSLPSIKFYKPNEYPNIEYPDDDIRRQKKHSFPQPSTHNGWFNVTDNTMINFSGNMHYFVIEINLDNGDMYYFKFYKDIIIHKKKTGFINKFQWQKVQNGRISPGLTRDLFNQYMFLEDHIEIEYDEYLVLQKIFDEINDVVPEEPNEDNY